MGTDWRKLSPKDGRKYNLFMISIGRQLQEQDIDEMDRARTKVDDYFMFVRQRDRLITHLYSAF